MEGDLEVESTQRKCNASKLHKEMLNDGKLSKIVTYNRFGGA